MFHIGDKVKPTHVSIERIYETCTSGKRRVQLVSRIQREGTIVRIVAEKGHVWYQIQFDGLTTRESFKFLESDLELITRYDGSRGFAPQRCHIGDLVTSETSPAYGYVREIHIMSGFGRSGQSWLCLEVNGGGYFDDADAVIVNQANANDVARLLEGRSRYNVGDMVMVRTYDPNHVRKFCGYSNSENYANFVEHVTYPAVVISVERRSGVDEYRLKFCQPNYEGSGRLGDVILRSEEYPFSEFELEPYAGESIDHGIPKTEFVMGDEVVVLKHVDKDLVGLHKRISAVYYTSRGTRYYVQGSSWGCDKNDFERIQSAYTLF